MRKQIVPLFFLLLLAACHQDNSPGRNQSSATGNVKQWQPPASGATVATYKERVTEDKLNEKYFTVTVKATENSSEGKYQVKLEYGFNINETDIQLPEWNHGVVLKPMLTKGKSPYHCLLGFDTGDGQFHELYEINAEGGDIRLKQTKGYYKTQ